MVQKEMVLPTTIESAANQGKKKRKEEIPGGTKKM
jgi:hypothetical protein